MKAVSPRSIDNLIGHRKKGQNVLREALKFASVKRFHDSYSALSGSRGTEGVYLSAIMAFSEFSGKDPDTLVQSLSRASQSELVAEVQSFVNCLVEEGKAPKTTQAYLSAVKGFLEINDIDVSVLRRRLRKPKVYVRSADRAPTFEELTRVYALSDLETRALLLFLLSSGCRIGEALQIQRSDLETVGGIHRIRIRPEIAKDRIGRHAFLTSEANEAVEAYLKTHGDPRVLPLPKSKAYHKLTRAFEKGMAVQKSEGRRDVHPHSVRKLFFTTALKVVGRELAEALIGHKQYLDQAYRRLTPEEMAASYNRLEPSLTLFPKHKIASNAEDRQVVVQSSEVEGLVSQGYEFVSLLPRGKAVLKAPKGSPDLREQFSRRKGESEST
jgi:integrase